jgi:hypothetical protein
MKKLGRFICLAIFAMAFSSCGHREQPTPALRMLSIGEIMESIVEPPADELWGSVATVVTAQGTDERQPKTDEEWQKVRHDAVSIIEAMNLITMEGRHAAREGSKSENPGIELEPAEIEKLIADDRPALFKLANALQGATSDALRSIDKKDPEGLLTAGEKMDNACENCHLKYWYPNDPGNKQNASVQKKDGEPSPKP